jgi:hypothetical protein
MLKSHPAAESSGRSASFFATLTVAMAVLLSAAFGDAQAAAHGGGRGGGGHGGGGARSSHGGGGFSRGRGYGGWGGGYFPASPLVYGYPYGCVPPLFYAPSYGYGYCD